MFTFIIVGPKGDMGADGAPGPTGPIGPQGPVGERYNIPFYNSTIYF